MPRRKLYHTPDEKKAAKKAENSRHYEKNKAAIQAHRQKRYAQKASKIRKAPDAILSRKERRRARKQNQTGRTVAHPDIHMEHVGDGNGAEVGELSLRPGSSDLIAYTVKEAHRASGTLNRLTEGSPKRFMDHVCDIIITRYHNGFDFDEMLDEYMIQFSTLHQTMTSYENNIWTYLGLGVEWKKAQAASQRVKEVTLWLDDVWMALHLDKGPESFVALHRKKGLKYQLDFAALPLTQS